VGIAAIQIAKMFNARVITTAGDDRKIEAARELGADYVINHYQQKISQEVRKITNFEGVDIVLEHVGAATWDESMKSLKSAGSRHLRRLGPKSSSSALPVLAPTLAAQFHH
jgi:NADPH:quinone reductase-like Zn-dependent oxidoreductase